MSHSHKNPIFSHHCDDVHTKTDCVPLCMYMYEWICMCCMGRIQEKATNNVTVKSH